LQFEKTDVDTFVPSIVTKYGKEFSIVEVPYCLKLLMHELTTMNVQMRLITADTIDSLTTAGKRSMGEFKTWAKKEPPAFLEKQKIESLLNQPLSDEEYKAIVEPEPIQVEPELEEYEPTIEATDQGANGSNANANVNANGSNANANANANGSNANGSNANGTNANGSNANANGSNANANANGSNTNAKVVNMPVKTITTNVEQEGSIPTPQQSEVSNSESNTDSFAESSLDSNADSSADSSAEPTTEPKNIKKINFNLKP
jgi:hypothetical protein